jgi:competence protein ComEC
LELAHSAVGVLAEFLQWLTSLATPLWSQHAPPMWAVILSLAGIAWLLAPRIVRYRCIGALWCLPLFTVTPTAPPTGEFQATILDVGQGTSAVIRTALHTLVYDAGPRWSDGNDAGKRLVAPFIRASGSGRINGLVVSHLDSDHSGGANALLREIPISWLATSMYSDADVVTEAKRRNVSAIACMAGQRWTWDEVRFEVLHPSATSYADGAIKTNDRSCVIKVNARSGSLLLTGDIEALSESELVNREASQLSADALLVPHHGSTTSSTPALLDAVRPRIAFVNAGYRNRFGHPRDDVLRRYGDRNISLHRTDWHGAITVESKDRFKSVRRERDQRQRYWIDRVDPGDRRFLD